MTALFKFMRSMKLSMALMLALLPIIAAGNMIPQQGRFSPADIARWDAAWPNLAPLVKAVGLQHVYASWWFLIIFALLFMNMAVVTWDLLGTTRVRSRGLHRYSADAAACFTLATLPYSPEIPARFTSVLKRRGYRLVDEPDGIYARRGWLGIWGGSILHVGLLVLLLGALITGLTRFNGFMELGEGQELHDTAASFPYQATRGMLFPGHQDNLAVRLEMTEVEQRGKMRIVKSMVTLSDAKSGEKQVATLQMNQPVIFHGMKLYQSDHTGPALLFVLAHSGLRQPMAAYVQINPADGRQGATFPMSGTPYQARVRYAKGDESATIEVRDRRELLYNGPIGVGQTLKLDDWYLTLKGVNSWTGLIVVYDRSVPVIFSGFFLCVFGIAVLGLMDPREIRIRRREESNEIEVTGWGRWRNMFADEFNDIRNEAGI